MKILFVVAGGGPTSVPKTWVDELRRVGHEVHCCRMESGYFRDVAKLILDSELYTYDVIHLNHTFGAFCGLFLWASGVPSVLTHHRDFRTLAVGSRVLHFIASCFSQRVVCNSKFTFSSLPYVLRRKMKTSIIYNGCEESSRPARKVRRLSPIVRLGFVGRLVSEKNVDELIRAISILNKEQNEHEFILDVVGGGCELKNLEFLVKEEDIEENVFFHGLVDRKQVFDIMLAIDCLVIPSLTEGYCNVAVEAMQIGVPVVSSPCGALPEVLGTTAFFSDSTTAKSISEAIKEFVYASHQVKELRLLEGVNRAADLSISNTIHKYERIYEEIVKR